MSDNFVTKEYLDKKLEEHAQVVVNAVDNVLEKRLNALTAELKQDINNVQTLIDGYVKAQEEFRQEFVFMKEELKKIKQVIKDKLGIEISSV